MCLVSSSEVVPSLLKQRAMVWKRKVVGNEEPKKRGRPRKNPIVEEVKEEAKEEATAAAPIEIEVSDARV